MTHFEAQILLNRLLQILAFTEGVKVNQQKMDEKY